MRYLWWASFHFQKNKQSETFQMNLKSNSVIALSTLVIGLCGLSACSTPEEDTPAVTVETPPPAAPAGEQDLTQGPAAAEPDVPEGMVEVTLKDDLDGNLNGYCLDIVGGGANIDPADGLQVHTCYSYRGSLGSDQAVDPDLMAEGTIKVSAFDVCATVPVAEAGAAVGLAACDDSAEQDFVIAESGTIAPANAPDICLTAGEDTRFGRNGTSPHQIKDLTLEACDPAISDRQEWRTREQDD